MGFPVEGSGGQDEPARCSNEGGFRSAQLLGRCIPLGGASGPFGGCSGSVLSCSEGSEIAGELAAGREDEAGRQGAPASRPRATLHPSGNGGSSGLPRVDHETTSSRGRATVRSRALPFPSSQLRHHEPHRLTAEAELRHDPGRERVLGVGAEELPGPQQEQGGEEAREERLPPMIVEEDRDAEIGDDHHQGAEHQKAPRDSSQGERCQAPIRRHLEHEEQVE
jgi:hypothetical protein